jgi:hypothetical protein
MGFYQIFLLASPNNIDVHNSILEYTSIKLFLLATPNNIGVHNSPISITMAWPFHSISPEIKFLKSVFLLIYH